MKPFDWSQFWSLCVLALLLLALVLGLSPFTYGGH